PLAAGCRVLALLAFGAVGCRGVSRVDFRVSPAGRPYVLEINTIPGFTATSLLPKAAARAGVNFGALCVRLLENAAFG
ncbi:MAG: D-alanine--D-alanine ligase, partial [Kiritimatiellae bacterium]|nr:D-alanine--D-alanine ligase [Kiritimatiellia bacterium]